MLSSMVSTDQKKEFHKKTKRCRRRTWAAIMHEVMHVLNHDFYMYIYIRFHTGIVNEDGFD